MSKFFRIKHIALCGLSLLMISGSLMAQQIPGGPPSEEGNEPPRQQERTRGGNSKIAGMGMAVGGETKKAGKFMELLAEKDLSMFRGYKQEEIGAGWSIDGKYLHFDGSGGGDIVTKDTFKDFDLQFEWKISEGGNSGVMYRVSLGDNAPYISGPEYQILDDEAHADGKNPQTSAGSLYALYAPEEDKTKPAGTWNKSRIVVENNKVTHYLNNAKVVEFELGSDDWNERVAESKFKSWEKFGKNEEGHIAFQDHGNEVWYRNIRIKPLDSGEEEEDSDRDSDRSQPGIGAPSEDGGGVRRPPGRGTVGGATNKFSKMGQLGVPGADKGGSKKDDKDKDQDRDR